MLNKFVNLINVMVNKDLSTKYKVLEILRNSKQAVSGQEIALAAGISRVSIWKAIQTLENSGYGIESTHSGYRLLKDLSDSIFPWEFGSLENNFSHFEYIDSTMNEARKIAEDDSISNSHVRVITADHQTQGKGHKKHKWNTTRGSLACTFITKTKIPAAFSHRIVMAAQVALAESLRSLSDKDFFVRWPNDIWTEKGKVAGILDDVSSTGSITNWINIGLGVNLSCKPDISKTDIAGCGITRKKLLSDFGGRFKKECRNAENDIGELCNRWNSLNFDRNRKVVPKGCSEKFEFDSINSFGFAVLKNKDGNSRNLIPGIDGIKK